MVVFRNGVGGFKEVAFFDVFAEEVKRGHELVVWVVEVSDLAFEVLDEL